MRRFTSRLLIVSLLVGVLSASAALAADSNGTSDSTWDQYVSWTSSSGDTGLSFDDWVILMGRIGVPIG
jgi:hypothetical protein